MTEYQRYQLQWMIDHNKSLEYFVRELGRYKEDCDPSDDLLEVFWSWEDNAGFESEIWACHAEWKDCEAQADPKELADALDECDTIIPEVEGFDNSQKLYAENKEFRIAVAKKYNDYWFDYLADCGDARFECVVDALSFVYKQWKEKGRIKE